MFLKVRDEYPRQMRQSLVRLLSTLSREESLGYQMDVPVSLENLLRGMLHVTAVHDKQRREIVLPSTKWVSRSDLTICYAACSVLLWSTLSRE